MRQLVPEILDSLPPSDPRAIASRRDLVWINALMRQRALMVAALREAPQPRRWADLGSGDGRFLLSVAKRLAPAWPDVEVIMVDRQPSVSGETREGFAALGWRCTVVAGDVFEMLQGLDADLITANLFLHHFSDADLPRLMSLAAGKASALIACEPRRDIMGLAASRLLFLLGCNHVTRHDAVASVRAGFRGQELSRVWPADAGWRLREYRGLPFSHIFTARHV